MKRTELSMPPNVQKEQVLGFSLYTLKVIMSGRGYEVLELAKINLLR